MMPSIPSRGTGTKHDLAIDIANKLVRSRIRGVLTPQSAEAVYRECLTHPDWSPNFDHLLVYEKIDLSELSIEAAQDMVQRFKALDDEYREGIPSKPATVMDSQLQAGILSFYEHISAPELVTEEAIFETVDEALVWLGRPA